MVIAVAALALVLAAGLIIAVAAIAVAATTAGAGAHLLGHRIGHFLIAGSSAFLNGQAKVLVHHREHVIQQLAGLQEALAQLILHHGRAQLVKLAEFLLRGGHAFHVLVAQGFAIFAHFAEQVGSLRVLIEKTDAGLSGHYFLAVGKGCGQFAGQLCQFRGKGRICHNARELSTLPP